MGTTIPNPFPVRGGTIVVTGPKGVGKSTLAATYAPPDMMGQVFWHDSERSANNIVRQLEDMGRPFGHYRNLPSRFDDLPEQDDLLAHIDDEELPWVNSRQKNALADYYEYVRGDLNQHMGKGQYKVYVHDTVEMLEAGMAAYVAANKKVTGWSYDSYGRMWTEAIYPLYNHLIEALYTRGVETVILTSHLKTPWEGSQPIPNAVKPAGKKILYTISSLMIWLVKGQVAPAGLVLKERLGELSVGADGEWDTERKLPRRIPVCTWREIRRYLREGCDLAHPALGEEPTPDEEQMMSDLLTDRQMDLMILTAEQKLQTASKPKEVTPAVRKETDEAKADADRMREEGIGPEEIQRRLEEKHSIPIALRVMKELGG